MSETPREVYTRFLEAIGQDRWDRLADFYAEDAVVEQPYAKPEPVVIKGAAALRERFAGRGELPLRLVPADVVIHETTDPEVVVAEFDYEVTVTTSGERFRTPNVIVLRIRDGRIVESRDYHDTGRIMAAVGRGSA